MKFFNEFLKAQSQQTMVAFGVAIGLSIACVIFSKIINKADPFARPKGIMLFLEMYYSMISNLVNSIFKGQMKMMVPYAGFLFIYIITMNYIPLFLPVEAGNTDYNVPLGLVSVTLILIHVTNIRYNGTKEYFKEFLQPFPIMLPLNLIDIVAKPLSMSMRLFGNVLSGSLILGIFSTFTIFLQNSLVGLFAPNFNSSAPIDVVGAVLAMPFHAYLDIFSGGIQAFVFTLLTLIFVSLSIDFDNIKGEN